MEFLLISPIIIQTTFKRKNRINYHIQFKKSQIVIGNQILKKSMIWFKISGNLDHLNKIEIGFNNDIYIVSNSIY